MIGCGPSSSAGAYEPARRPGLKPGYWRMLIGLCRCIFLRNIGTTFGCFLPRPTSHVRAPAVC